MTLKRKSKKWSITHGANRNMKTRSKGRYSTSLELSYKIRLSRTNRNSKTCVGSQQLISKCKGRKYLKLSKTIANHGIIWSKLMLMRLKWTRKRSEVSTNHRKTTSLCTLRLSINKELTMCGVVPKRYLIKCAIWKRKKKCFWMSSIRHSRLKLLLGNLWMTFRKKAPHSECHRVRCIGDLYLQINECRGFFNRKME